MKQLQFVCAFALVATPALATESEQRVSQYKAVVRQAIEALQEGDLKTLNDIYDPKGLVHLSTGIRENGGPFSDLKDACPMCEVLSPRSVTIELMVAEEDLVTVRAIFRGTHSGPYRGVPASGKKITFTYTNVFRIRDGRIVENWVGMDRLGLMEQLGMKLCPQGAPK